MILLNQIIFWRELKHSLSVIMKFEIKFWIFYQFIRGITYYWFSFIMLHYPRLLEILEGWILSIPAVASSDSNHPSWSHQRCLAPKRKAVEGNTYLFWITPLATLLFRNHATFCTTLQAAADFFKTKQFKKIKKLPNKICYQIYS